MQNQWEKTVNDAVRVLRSGGVLLYPTDTIWGLGCDATDAMAVEKIYRIKRRSSSKSLIILVDSTDMLQRYVPVIPKVIRDFLGNAERPTTVIYEHPKSLAANVIAGDDSVAIRIVKNDFCEEMIRKFGKPVVSTSANFSNEPSPSSYEEIDPLLLKQADYIVNLPTVESKNTASQIIRVNDLGEVEFLRK